MDRGHYCDKRFCHGPIFRGNICLAANRFHVRKRALPVFIHQLLLQPAVIALADRLVVEGLSLVASIWLVLHRSYSAMVATSLLSERAGIMRIERSAVCPKS